MEQLIERARQLLGWPTPQKLVRLAHRFPDEEVWRSALNRLQKADHPNETYLVKCLETAKGELEHRQRSGSRPERLNLRICPYSPGLVCPGAPPDCKGEVECYRIDLPPWGKQIKEMLSKNPSWLKS